MRLIAGVLEDVIASGCAVAARVIDEIHPPVRSEGAFDLLPERRPDARLGTWESQNEKKHTS